MTTAQRGGGPHRGIEGSGASQDAHNGVGAGRPVRSARDYDVVPHIPGDETITHAGHDRGGSVSVGARQVGEGALKDGVRRREIGEGAVDVADVFSHYSDVARMRVASEWLGQDRAGFVALVQHLRDVKGFGAADIKRYGEGDGV